MSETRSIRRKTSDLIASYERERTMEIEKLRSEYIEKEKELLQESARREKAYAQKLIELEKEQQRQLALGQEELAQKTRKLAEDMSQRLTELQDSTQAEIRRQREEMEAMVAEAFQRVERKIRRLYEMIEDKEQREETYAEDCVERARKELTLLQESEAVRMFRGFAVHPLVAQFNRLTTLSAQQLWISMAAAAVNVESHSESVKAEAEHLYARWQAKREALRGRLAALREKCESAGGKESVFSFGAVEGYPSGRRPWAEEAFSQVESSLEEMRIFLSSDAPCSLEDLDQTEGELMRLDDRLEAAVMTAEQQISVFLMIADALAVLREEMEVYGEGWSAPEGFSLREKEIEGEMTLFSNGSSLQVTMRQNPRNAGEAIVTMTCDSPAMQEARRDQLRRICTHMALAWSQPANGSLSMGQTSFFKTGRLICVTFPLAVSVGAFQILEPSAEEARQEKKEASPVEENTGRTDDQSRKEI